MKTPLSEEYDFHTWTVEELFNHLIDLGILPFEEELEYWKWLKPDLLQMCQESYKNQEI